MPFVKCPECGKLNSVKLKNCPKCEASLEIVRMSVDNTQPAGGFNPGMPQPQAMPWGQPAHQPMPQDNPWGQPAQQPMPQNNPWGGQPVQQPAQPRTNPWGQPAQPHAAQQPVQPHSNPWSQPVQQRQPSANPWGQPVQQPSMPQNNPWGQPVQQPAGNPWGGQPATASNAAPTHCSNCGTELMPGASFCGMCGKPVAAQQPSGIPVRKNPYCI